MDLQLILRLVGLRYKLLWAQTRTRNGRIALFFTGYLFAILIVILMTAGGYGAAMLAVRSGKAEFVARVVLGSLFLNALFASVITGFGINTAFTDAALRRYPLSAGDRLAARHLTGLLEPIWIFVLALFLGLSTGMYVFGVGAFWQGAAAVLLLLVANYLLARVMATLIEWLGHVRGGTSILFLLLMTICMMPAIIVPRLTQPGSFKSTMLAALAYSPPFASAALVVNKGAILYNFALLIGWIAALLVLLAAVEKQAARPRRVTASAVNWDDRYERIASIFGPALTPLVGRSLRYYMRSNKVRFNFIAAIPALGFLTFFGHQGPGAAHYFIRSLGSFAIVGFLGTASMSSNQFGFDSAGFRRYFLLPVEPGVILRASSYTAVYLGSVLMLLALVLWFSFAPVAIEPRMVPMLIGSAVGGLFLFNALAIWTSLLSPRRTDFESTFGNQLSLGANILVIGGVMLCVFGIQFLDQAASVAAVLSYWWVPLVGALGAAIFYDFSLRAGARVFVRRRESLLNLIEGRS